MKNSLFIPLLSGRKQTQSCQLPYWIFLLIPLWLMSVTSATAQATKVLTLEETVKLGVEHSKQLKVAQSRIDASVARTHSQAASRIPSVSLTSNYTRLSNNVQPFQVAFPGSGEPVTLNPQILNQYTNRISANEVIFGGFRQQYQLESARYLEKASRLDYERDHQEMELNLVNAYYNLYKIRLSQRLVEENLKRLQESLNNAQRLQAQGAALNNDVLRVNLQIDNLRYSQIELENNYQTAANNLAIMLGLSPDTRLDVDSNQVAFNQAVQDLGTYTSQAVSNRSELKAAELRSQAAETSLKASRSAYFPTLSAGANYYYNRPNQRVFPQQDQFKNTWDAGLTLSFNLSNLYTNKNNIAEATATVHQNQAQKEFLSESVQMEVNQNYQALQTARQKIELAQRSLSQAEENYRIMQSRYRNNVALLTDLLDADVTLLQTKLNLYLAQTDAQLAWFRLKKATGEPLFQ